MRKSCIAILVFVFAVAGSAHAACPSFVNSGTYGLSDYLHDSAVGDFNNDGRMDIVGVNGSKTDVLLQNEDGSFSRSSITAGSPWGVAVGDLNRDGKLDI